MKNSQRNKFHCSTCRKFTSVATEHIPTLREGSISVVVKPGVDFVEKIYCLKCGRRIK